MEKMYCLKCKKKVDVDTKKVKTKNNRWALKGPCKVCGTTCFKFTSSD